MNNCQFIEMFEHELCEYTGFNHCVCVSSCTDAVFLSLNVADINGIITIPRYTYISIPFVLQRLNLDWKFSNKEWKGFYNLTNTNVVDSAVYMSKNMANIFNTDDICCLSFGEKKAIKIGKGGAILFNNSKYLNQLRRLSYDGRDYTVNLSEDKISFMGYHMNMCPSDASKGLHQLNLLKNKEMLINNNYTDYLDLTKFEVFNRSK